MWQGLLLVAAVTFAYALDYLFNLAAGRLLAPAEFSIVVSLAGVGQVLVVASRVIQTVTTRYISQFQAGAGGDGRTASFFRAMFRAGWRWGVVAALIAVALSWPLARFLQIEEIGPVLALAVTTLLWVVRPVINGALQGVQRFGALGSVRVVEASLRLATGILLMWLGWGAFGAMSALPIASAVAMLVSLVLLNQTLATGEETPHAVSPPDIVRYFTYTAFGLIGFALLVNMDAILVRRFFDPETAGIYSGAITLGKIIQFFPLAIILILFPKAAQRQASRRDPGGVLIAAMLVVGLICGGLALAYTLFSDIIVRLTLGEAYQIDGRVLGLVGVAMLLQSLANVWLNYFLSTEWPRYVYLVGAAILLQGGMMLLVHDQIWHLPAAMAINGGWLTVAGGVIFWQRRRKR
jgi:O-antigen/teichoic acid export membrane protein